MKKLFIVVRSISFGAAVGGMEKAANQHISEMLSLGYEITLIAPENKVSGQFPGKINFINVKWPRWDKYKILMTMGLAYTHWCKSVAKCLALETSELDIVHLHGASAGVLGFMEKEKLQKIVTVVNPHGMEEFGTGSVLRLINRKFTRSLLMNSKYADAVIATDSILVPAVINNLKITKDKICIIPNTIDIKKLRSLSLSAHSKNDNGRASIKFVSVGRIEYNKGYDLLAKAFTLLMNGSSLGIDFEWIHYGRGKKKNSIVDYCMKNKIPAKFLSNSSDSEVQTAIASCDIFVQPSRYEGSSLTTLEAMTHGALIVAMPVGGIPDKIIDNKTGFLCKEVTVSALAETLAKAINNISDKQIRENAKIYVEENFDISSSTKKYHDLYQKKAKEKVRI
ncbi:glycosyltransferase family 4 protein [Klebsiella pneumoniae]|nr:glycosyltransferase family 4 protein [Klebsiella pneumoniae]MCD5718981.1 glycosyltransferase family 4 protein [Klebsiella pneumoniae]MCP5600762.1 glycosyltransferase family 4 protein [Klebsiella pneumoniae]HBS6221392.1 glycosyltransferase family 4 protein [Klebsiella pneumoniae]